jgi:aryl-alcohol dehydrogenase-like predicted oxidoreductase
VIPLEEQFGAISDLRDEGKVRFVGVSEVSLAELGRARRLVDIATVQNRFSLGEQAADDVLQACEEERIGFIPWAPIAMGDLPGSSRTPAGVAARHGATEAQIALAWLLGRSPVVLPIPGTGSLEHLRENCNAAMIELSGQRPAGPGGAGRLSDPLRLGWRVAGGCRSEPSVRANRAALAKRGAYACADTRLVEARLRVVLDGV